MVTHAAGGSRIGSVLTSQLSAQPRAMYIAAGVLGSFGLVPGLPSLPFLVLAGVLASLARVADKAHAERDAKAAAEVKGPETAPTLASPMKDLLQIDPIELEVGYALIPLVDEAQGGDLLERIGLLRKQAALELGVLVPAVRIRDDVRLPANEYVIKLRGSQIARAEVMPRFVLALDTGGVLQAIDGIETVDPSFGMPARWISPGRRTEAEAAGYVVVEATTMIATHLMETVKSNAADLLGRQDVQEMLETLKKTHPVLVDDVIPAKVSLGTLHRVLQRLLRERVPIRDLVTILEAVGDSAELVKDPEQLTEHVRRALGNVIARLFLDDSGGMRAIALGPRLEASLMGVFGPRNPQSAASTLTSDALAGLLRELQKLAATTGDAGPVPLVVPPGLRVGVRRLLEPVMPALPVVSLAELPPFVNLTTVALWEMKELKLAAA
jgi:flagellar biosynthesis protein FlhA